MLIITRLIISLTLLNITLIKIYISKIKSPSTIHSLNVKKRMLKTSELSRPFRARDFEDLVPAGKRSPPTRSLGSPLEEVSVACQLRRQACESREPESTRSAQSLIALCTHHVAAVTIPRSIKKTSKIIRRRMLT